MFLKRVHGNFAYRGNQCVSVDSLSMTSFGTYDMNATSLQQVTFAIWFKRITPGGTVATQQGVELLQLTTPSYSIKYKPAKMWH